MGEGPIHNPHPPLSTVLPLLPELLLLRGVPEGFIIVGDGQVPPLQPLSMVSVSAEETIAGRMHATRAMKQRAIEALDEELLERSADLIIQKCADDQNED